MSEHDSIGDSHATLEDFTRRWTGAFDETAVFTTDDGTIVPRSLIESAETTEQLKTLPYLPLVSQKTDEVGELELGETLGKGGMGVVRLGRQRGLRREVAIKCPRRDRGNQATTALLREALAGGALEHPNIVPIYTLGRSDDGEPLIVMKRIQGVSWRELLDSPDHPLLPKRVAERLQWHLELLIQVCNALRFAHSRGILHRDIKPDNVMIGDFGEVYVLDWGLAAADQRTDDELSLPVASAITELAGTPGYMAPEMADPLEASIDRRTDVYLLGALLHELLTGEVRHPGKTPVAQIFASYHTKPYVYDASVPEELAEACNRATARDKEQRYQSVDELREAIVRALRHGASRELTAEAETRREQLEELIHADPKAHRASAEGVGVQQTFIECRFGYQQALRTWPENPQAKGGLRAVMHAMVEYEIARHERGSAAALLAQIDDPEPKLLAAMAELKKSQHEKARRFEALEAIERDIDLKPGERARQWFAFFVAIGWLINNMSWGMLARYGLFQAGYGTYLAIDVGYAALCGALVYAFRSVVLQNAANKRLVAIGFSAMAIFAVVWSFEWATGQPFRAAILRSNLLMGAIIPATALGIAPRLMGSALGFLGTYGVGLLLPGFEFEVSAIGGFLSFSCLALLLKVPDSPSKRAGNP